MRYRLAFVHNAFGEYPTALKSIRKKFEERVFLDAKSRLNDRVTPW